MNLTAGESLERGQVVYVTDDGTVHPLRQEKQPLFYAPCVIEKGTVIKLATNADGSQEWQVNGHSIPANARY